MFVQIITTGGTIDKIYFDAKSEFQVGEPQIGEVLQRSNVTFAYGITSLLRKDSLEMTESDRQLIYDAIAADATHDRFVVTHGTDTMALTGRKLAPLAAQNKVIVLTGSMQPARFHLTDAIFNIASAVTAVQILPPGVYIAMNGRIYDPARVRKNVALHQFEEELSE